MEELQVEARGCNKQKLDTKLQSTNCSHCDCKPKWSHTPFYKPPRINALMLCCNMHLLSINCFGAV